MPVSLQQITFAALAALIIGSAVMVVTLRNIFHSLLFLALCFLGVAGVYLLLAADFLAAVQVLIYIGAIVVLMMFALMLTHRVMAGNLTQTTQHWWLALPVALGMLWILFRLFVLHPWGVSTPTGVNPTTAIIGRALLTKYVLPFELASVVLLVAMIGAIVLAKEDKPDDSA